MAAFPGSAVKLTYINKTFKAEGYGRMTIVTPQGRTLRGTLPFTIKGKKLKRVKKAKGPLLTTDKPVPVTVGVSPAAPTATSPITVSFTTTSPLPKGRVYEIGLTYTGGGCGQTVVARVDQPAKGKLVTATLTPPADRPQWCKGSAVAGVLAVGKDTTGFALGDILGYKLLTFR
jgi:hypothetical protein